MSQTNKKKIVTERYAVMIMVVTRLFGYVRHDTEVVCVNHAAGGYSVHAGVVSWGVGRGTSV